MVKHHALLQGISLSTLLLLSSACSNLHAPAFSLEREVGAWVQLWTSYDLDRVPALFLQDARVSYLSSEREGLIVGPEGLIEHHRGFGFVPGGRAAEQELWVSDLHSSSFGATTVVTGVWFFGDRNVEDADNQRGPMTMVYVFDGQGYRLAHMHFANYESAPEMDL